ncbi:MAG: hypothetical protein RR365_08625 [Bacteroides sp.]
MSINKNIYGIIGFDLTSHRDEILTEDFYESVIFEELDCNHVVGETQLFTDPADGIYLYFGYILFQDDGRFDENMSAFKLEDLVYIAEDIESVFNTYFDIDIGMSKAQVIIFTEFS